VKSPTKLTNMKFAQKTLTHFKIPKMFGLRAHSIEGVAGLGCVGGGGRDGWNIPSSAGGHHSLMCNVLKHYTLNIIQ
jgi:hypothetical protein